MSRHSLLIGMVLLLATVLQAQDLVRVEYFLDTDPGYGLARSANSIRVGDNLLEFDVSDAAPGYHLLNVRSQDSEGRWSATMSRPLFIDRLQDIVYVEFFIDNDPGLGKGTPVSLPDIDYKAHLDLGLQVSTEGLSLGKHELYVRARDAFDQWTDVMSRSFTIVESSPMDPEQKGDLVRMEYFFDADPGYGKGFPLTKPNIGENTYEMSFESLTPGYHLLSLRAQDELGRWSTVMSRPIFVTNSVKMAVEYFIDKDPGEGKAVSVSMPEDLSNAFAFEVPTEQLEVGEHLLCVRSKGDNGIWKMVSSKTFTVGKAGDVNGDGNVDEEDLSLIVQAIMGQLSNEDLRKKTDINHDGKVDAADLVALTNLILYGKIVPK